MLLEFHRNVKGALNGKGVLTDMRKFRTLQEPLEGTPRFVIDLDFFGADPGFAGELLGGHEEIKQGNQRRRDGGQEDLFLKALKPVVADIFTDKGTVFCSTKQLSFFRWFRLRVKGRCTWAHQISVV
jgi:hypothetical protein